MNQTGALAYIDAKAEAFCERYNFTSKECEIFRGIFLHNMDNALLGGLMNVEPEVVQTYLVSLLEKTGSRSREKLFLKFHTSLLSD